jgi:hypothetical protein
VSTTESELAALQIETADQAALLPEDKRVKRTVDGPSLTFKDEEFALSEEIGYMALMEWAAASDLAVDSGEGLIAIYHMLQSVLRDDTEFKAFRAHARVTKGGPEELLDFINAAMEAITARPTEGREPSADGSSASTPASKARTDVPRAKGSKR